MRFTKTFIFILLTSFGSTLSLAQTPVPTPIDFHKTILPILKNSCFACHVVPTDTFINKNPNLEKSIEQYRANGTHAFTMDIKFPFPADKGVAGQQLKSLNIDLTQGKMPPFVQIILGMGAPLSEKNRKVLLAWVLQEQINLIK